MFTLFPRERTRLLSIALSLGVAELFLEFQADRARETRYSPNTPYPLSDRALSKRQSPKRDRPCDEVALLQRLQEYRQIIFLLRGQSDGEALVVEINHLEQITGESVVHVR